MSMSGNAIQTIMDLQLLSGIVSFRGGVERTMRA